MNNGSLAKILILVAMVIIIISIIITPNNNENIKLQQQSYYNKYNNDSSGNNNNYSKPLKDIIPLKYKIGIIFLIALGIIYFILTTKNDAILFQKNIKLNNIKDRELKLKYNKVQYVKPVDKYTYISQATTTTQKELEKLKNNSKYLNMLKERGFDKSKWNWQTAEKESKQVWREEHSDNSDTNLSYI